MEELYSILRDLLEVEYNQKSLLYILEILESAYEEPEQDNIKLTVNHTKGCIKELQAELNAVIRKLDSYIAGGAVQR